MYKKGAVVLVPFPFTDLSGSKVRPAVIISKKLIGDDINITFVSSKKGRKVSTDVLLKADVNNGLKVDSVLKTHKIATLDKKVVLGELGKISQSTQDTIDQQLKKILDL